MVCRWLGSDPPHVLIPGLSISVSIFHSETRPESHYLLLATQLLLRLYIFSEEWDKDALKWNFPVSTVECQSCR
jgi:hypothetical protein